jgi:hypothetical protein
VKLLDLGLLRASLERVKIVGRVGVDDLLEGFGGD